MNTKRITSLIAILILGLIWNTAHGADCLDFRNLIGTSWPGGTGYNNDSLYPAGSTILSAGGVKIIKTYTTGNWNPPYNTYFTASTDTTFDVNGYITLDVSASTFSCKELTFTSLYGRPSPFIVDGDTIPNTANPYSGNGFTMNAVGNTFTVSGSFNSILLYASNLGLGDICLEDCSVSSNCVDYRNLIGTSWPGNTGYNDDILYPAGSTILSSGGVSIVKTHTAGNWNPPFNTIFTSHTDTTLLLSGAVTLDVSASTYTCKELTFTTMWGPSVLVVDGDTLPNPSTAYAGNGFNVSVTNSTYTVTGSFNTVSMYSPNLGLGDICLEDCSVASSACLDFRNLIGTSWPGNTGYNDDSLYPAGSTILSAGDVKIVKTHPYGNWNPPLVTSFAFGNDSSITGDGYMTIDVASSTYPCKQLSFSTIASTLIINGDTITNFGASSSYSGSGYNIVVSNMNVVVTGSFNTVILGGPNLTIGDVCLDSCSSSMNGCLIADDLDSSKVNLSTGGYNDDNTYPAGSVLASQNNINIIKTFGYTTSPNTHLGGLWNGQLSFWGGLTFDMSASTYSCKKLTLRISGGGVTAIYADNDTLLTRNGYTVNQIAFDHYEIQGTFNTVTFIDQSTSMFASACLEDCSINTSSCIDFQDTTLFLTIPTSQNNYGSPWYLNNGVSFSSKYYDYTFFNNPGEVVIGDHIVSGYTGSNGSSNYVGNIFHQGNTITQIDFSALALNPKQIEFDVNYILNNSSVNPYYINGQPLTNLPVGVTFIAAPLTNGYHITITGNVNTIEVHGFEVGIDNMCVDSVSTLPCIVNAMFTYTASQSVVAFTNGSSVTAANADQFIWNFGDGNTSSGDNDPIHTYGAPGSYWVCLTVVDFTCSNNPTAMYCDSVIIGNCQNGQSIITPNDDGLSDNVDLVAGSRIYDRNGFLVKKVTSNLKWAGKNDNNEDLPMGLYTVICPDNGVLKVTIVK
jgi:hypothetical protein